MSDGKEVKRWWHLEASGDGDKDSVVVYGTKDDAKRDLANLLYFGSYEDAVQDDFVAAILSDFDDEENNWSRDGVWDHRGEQCYFRVSKIDRVENDRIVAELRAEVEKLRHDCGNHNISQADIDWCVLCDRESNVKTIATQARKLDLARVLYYAAIKMIDRYSKEKFPLNQTHTIENVMDRYDQELAAIEKEGVKDEKLGL